jgi:integrase
MRSMGGGGSGPDHPATPAAAQSREPRCSCGNQGLSMTRTRLLMAWRPMSSGCAASCGFTTGAIRGRWAALLFLFRELLERDLDLEGVVRARQKRRLPVVLTPGEVRAVLERMDGVEALRLRVKDLDCERRELTVRDGKGGNDRRTMLPLGVGERLREQLREGKRLHEKDLADGYGRVQRPGALSRKYRHADREWNWQGVFPQHQRWRNDETGEQGRHHLDPSLVQQAIRRAVMAAAISKPAPPTAFANPLPPISWNGGMTSARFRNCSAKATSGPQ